jgi:hypothetical protein
VIGLNHKGFVIRKGQKKNTRAISDTGGKSMCESLGFVLNPVTTRRSRTDRMASKVATHVLIILLCSQMTIGTDGGGRIIFCDVVATNRNILPFQNCPSYVLRRAAFYAFARHYDRGCSPTTSASCCPPLICPRPSMNNTPPMAPIEWRSRLCHLVDR